MRLRPKKSTLATATLTSAKCVSICTLVLINASVFVLLYCKRGVGVPDVRQMCQTSAYFGTYKDLLLKSHSEAVATAAAVDVGQRGNGNAATLRSTKCAI